MILSLEDPDAYELSPEQEAEIRKRVRRVKSGKAVGRPAAEVLAEIELWEAVQFYENRCAGLGLDFEKEIKAATEFIQRSPGRWPLHKDGTRRYLIHRFPYFVVYVVHKGHVWVIAFAHCRRKPGYWSGRAKRAEPRRGRRRE